MAVIKICRLLYVCTLCFVICHFAYAWFAYDLWSGTIFAFLGLLAFLCGEIGFREKKKLKGWTILLYIILAITGFITDGDIIAVLRNLIAYLIIISLFRLSNNNAKWVLQKITYILGVVLAISLILYVLNIAHIPLPTISYSQVLYYNFTNHIFFIDIDILDYYGTFTGFCLEPGYLALLCVCVIVANNYEFKRDKILFIFLVSILCSASLGGIVLCIVGYLVKNFNKGKLSKKVKILLFSAITIALFIILAMNYNGGDNIIVNRVLVRTFLYNSDGIFVNNRENPVAEFYINRIFYSSDVWMGVGSHNFLRIKESTEDWDACSWRIFIVVYGVIYTLFFVFIYHMSFYKRVPRQIYIMVVSVLLFDFYQHGTFFNESLYLYLLLFMSVDYYGREKKHIGNISMAYSK